MDIVFNGATALDAALPLYSLSWQAESGGTAVWCARFYRTNGLDYQKQREILQAARAGGTVVIRDEGEEIPGLRPIAWTTSVIAVEGRDPAPCLELHLLSEAAYHTTSAWLDWTRNDRRQLIYQRTAKETAVDFFQRCCGGKNAPNGWDTFPKAEEILSQAFPPGAALIRPAGWRNRDFLQLLSAQIRRWAPQPVGSWHLADDGCLWWHLSDAAAPWQPRQQVGQPSWAPPVPEGGGTVFCQEPIFPWAEQRGQRPFRLRRRVDGWLDAFARMISTGGAAFTLGDTEVMPRVPGAAMLDGVSLDVSRIELEWKPVHRQCVATVSLSSPRSMAGPDIGGARIFGAAFEKWSEDGATAFFLPRSPAGEPDWAVVAANLQDGQPDVDNSGSLEAVLLTPATARSGLYLQWKGEGAGDAVEILLCPGQRPRMLGRVQRKNPAWEKSALTLHGEGVSLAYQGDGAAILATDGAFVANDNLKVTAEQTEIARPLLVGDDAAFQANVEIR